MLDSLETRVPPPVWALLSMALVFLASLVVNERSLSEGGSKVLAIAIAVIGIAVAVSAVTGFGRAKTTVDPHAVKKASTLVTSGVYRFTRNPMYLGLLCLVIAVGFWRGSVIATAIGAAAFVMILTRVQIIPEERALERRFGKSYREFTSSVRRWL